MEQISNNYSFIMNEASKESVTVTAKNISEYEQTKGSKAPTRAVKSRRTPTFYVHFNCPGCQQPRRIKVNLDGNNAAKTCRFCGSDTGLFIEVK